MKVEQILFGCLLCAGISVSLSAQEKATPISVVTVGLAPVYDEIPLTGSVLARRTSRISPKLDGFVAEVLVDAGDSVKKDAVLLHLDPVIAKIELARAKAQSREALAILTEARRQLDEAAELVKKKHISATDFEARAAEVRIREAVLSRLQEDVNQQQELLARHVVYAPFDGAVVVKGTEVGQWVETGTTLFELVEISVLRIDVPVPQIYFDRISRGTPVNIRFDAFPERSFAASVTIKIPTASASTRTFPVRIELENRDELIAPGMSARVMFRLAESGDTKLVPRDVIVRKPDGSESVWILEGSGEQATARSIAVRTGRAYRDNVEVIADALQAGDQVVIRGNEILQENQSVKVVSEIELKL